MKLNRQARDQLRAADVTVAAWTRKFSGPHATTWLGDACGCPDDRCIGVHHDVHDDCQCLPALLSEHTAT